MQAHSNKNRRDPKKRQLRLSEWDPRETNLRKETGVTLVVVPCCVEKIPGWKMIRKIRVQLSLYLKERLWIGKKKITDYFGCGGPSPSWRKSSLLMYKIISRNLKILIFVFYWLDVFLSSLCVPSINSFI